MLQGGRTQSEMSKLASQRLDDLLNGFGNENILSW
jgi:hypothetical protein